MKKRIMSLICLVLTLCMCFSACGENEDETITDIAGENNANTLLQDADIILPYSSSDSLNPYFAIGSENAAIAFLYCQPLFEVKADYSPEAIIADSYNVENSAVTVTIKPVLFSDGSEVSARDIVYSFNKAKASTGYSQRLSNITGARVSGNSVVFSLASPDVFTLNILTFPIVKNATAEASTDIPIGSGVFVLNQDNTMTINPNSQKQSLIKSVRLNDIKKLEYITNELEIGNINYLFEDFSSGSYKRIVAQNKTVVINNLVYLGFNSGVGALASSAVRTAIYYAVDKDNVSASAYQGYSKVAQTPFNPDFCQLSGVTVPDAQGSNDKCISILEKLGYSRFQKNGARTNGTNNLEFSILVNSDNAFRLAAAYKIAENLEAVSIKATVDAVSSDIYQQRIAAGDFQMYLGEVKLTENMDLSVFINGAASVGIDKTQQFFNDYAAFREGTIGMQEIVDSFMNSVPFMPICYRAGMAAYSKAYTPDFTYAPFNIYGNIENWEKAE